MPSGRYAPLLDRLARSEGRIALGLVAAYGLVFGALSLVRQWSFHSTGLDLGVFDQVVWNTSQGRFMESTLSLDRCTAHSFLGDHFSPILIALVPLYWFAPHPETLLVAQTVALASGAWPVYLLAKRLLPPGIERLIWVLAYVFSAPLAFVTLYDFHEVALAVLPLGLAMYFLVTRRTLPLILALLVAFTVKEEVALIGVGFGVALAFQGRWRSAALVGLGSAAVFVVTMTVLIPAFAGAAYQYLDRYASLGGSVGEIARTLAFDPLRAISVLLEGEIGSKIVFVLSLFGPGALLAFRSRWAVIPSLVPLGYLLLSDYGGEHTLHNQYGAPIIPLALGASIVGFARLGPVWRPRFTVAALMVTVFFCLVFGGWPFSREFQDAYLRGNPDRAPSGASMFAREPRYDALLAQVHALAPDAAIASTDFWITQVGERRFNYHLAGLEPCDAGYVILDWADPDLNRDPARFAAARAAMLAKGFDEIASGVGLSLLRRR
ncbi:MAG TPA: DUF2079 domain-containing protein [Candidatus Limnocylindria bacterium]|nr:DUF2079 domain-containing protein [Candidatus Limnocylindria bacterium]